ncbi:MAG: hypothetical protein PV340_05280 [Wolbachia sp.]|nr:hypothetical protein [Wolbachia sp.]MDD9336007.1 hypothetical protein [Wolbachia sp.]
MTDDLPEYQEQVKETEQHLEKSGEEELKLDSEEPKLESAGKEEPTLGVIQALDA